MHGPVPVTCAGTPFRKGGASSGHPRRSRLVPLTLIQRRSLNKESTPAWMVTRAAEVSRNLALGCISLPVDDRASVMARTGGPWMTTPPSRFFRPAARRHHLLWTRERVQHGTPGVFGRAIKRSPGVEDIVLATKVFGKMHDAPAGWACPQCDLLACRCFPDPARHRLHRPLQIHRFGPTSPIRGELLAPRHVKAARPLHGSPLPCTPGIRERLHHAAASCGWPDRSMP